MLGELVREVRRFGGLGATYFRALAGQVGLNATDLQVVDILASAGPATAGQLAGLTGLTTGATAQMLGRLEKDGVVRRERDPDDGRRVLVSLAPDWDKTGQIGPALAGAGSALEVLAARYDDQQLALLREFIAAANAAYGEEIYRLREEPAEGGAGEYSAPLADVEHGTFIFLSWASKLILRGDAGMAELYRAQFKGQTPEVRVAGGVVTMRYPRRLRTLFGSNQAAEVALNTAVPWRIELRNGASHTTADLRGLTLAGLEIRGGASSITVRLPAPSGSVPVRIAGGVSGITINRPQGVEVSIRLKGWAAHLTFDDQTFDALGADGRLQSPGYAAATRRYDIEVDGGASDVTVTALG
ncbi:MAG: MarR family transcriptional regulator [Thermomicrobiales bacterium]